VRRLILAAVLFAGLALGYFYPPLDASRLYLYPYWATNPRADVAHYPMGGYFALFGPDSLNSIRMWLRPSDSTPFFRLATKGGDTVRFNFGGIYTTGIMSARRHYDGPTQDTTTRLATMQFVRDSSGTVTSVAESVGIKCTPNPITVTGKVSVDTTTLKGVFGTPGDSADVADTVLAKVAEAAFADSSDEAGHAGAADSSAFADSSAQAGNAGTADSSAQAAHAYDADSSGIAGDAYHADSSDVSSVAHLARNADSLGGSAASAYRRLAPRTCDTASTATPTPNCDSIDQYNLTALAADATYGAPTGTPHDGQRLLITIVDDGTARALTWASGAGGYQTGNERVVLPTTTLVGYRDRTLFLYTEASGMWECLAHSLSEVTP